MENAVESFSPRPATLDDIPLVAEIEKRVHKAPWVESHFEAELEKPFARFLVMTDDETDSKVAAYIVFWLLMGEVQILDVAVDLPFRGMGFAQKLVRLAAIEGIQKDAKRAVLDVRKSNQPAIQLYQKLNFSIAHVRKAFYSDGEDAYQMELSLQEDGIKFD